MAQSSFICMEFCLIQFCLSPHSTHGSSLPAIGAGYVKWIEGREAGRSPAVLRPNPLVFQIRKQLERGSDVFQGILRWKLAISLKQQRTL